MGIGDTAQGRRREDVPLGELPDDPQPGDYWKYLDRAKGEPMRSSDPQNLTGTVWGIRVPDTGFSIGTLMHHTVREHEDGTITVAPDDGSSNSILVTAGRGSRWHGFIDRGVWREA